MEPRRESSAPQGEHERKVERISRELRARTGTRPVSLRKRTPSHQVPKRNDRRRTDDRIDISDLDQLLEIDPLGRTCTAEPGVTFLALVQHTLRYGLVPIVVPEHKTITLGGAVAGCSIESMSFKEGGFHDTCLEYEVITARGEVLQCTPHNPLWLIFQMMHGSFGTLGIVSRLKFRLVPAKPYVQVTYRHYRSLAGYQQAIWRHFLDRDVDFMDGMVLARDEYLLSLGRWTDHPPYVSRYRGLKVYPESARQREEDYLETLDYLFRYDRGVTQVWPRSPVARALVGRWVHSDSLLRAAERFHRLLPVKRPHVIVDLFIPFSRVGEFLDWYGEAIGFYPVWVVPYRRVHDYEWVTPRFWAGVSDPLFLDLAIYGLKQPQGRNYYRELEEALPGVNGLKTLISYNYYDRETFWSVWNRDTYEAVKRITDPDNLFRDLYAKTCRAPLGLD